MSFADLFGSGSIFGQLLLWNVGGQVFSAIVNPPLTQVQQDLWVKALSESGEAMFVAPSPADLADWVERGLIDQGQAQGLAAKSGVRSEDFTRMVENAGEPPGVEWMQEAARRGFIPTGDAGPEAPSLTHGVATSRIYTYWLDVINQMSNRPLPTADLVDAVVRNQINGADGATMAWWNGINPDQFGLLIETAGNPPSPTELIEMVRRGKIPQHGTGADVLSFDQGIYEGDTKDKWIQVYEELITYIPPPRIVTTLYRSGAITAAQATQYFQDAGLSPELAAAYLKSVEGEKLAGTRQLAQGVVQELYEAQAISHADATTALNVLGYTNAQADFILELFDLRRETQALNKAINRVGALYTRHKITRTAAVAALGELGVTGDHQANLMATWDLQAASEVQEATISQLGKAVKYANLSPDIALVAAERLGYSAFDAWVALSAEAEQPITPTAPAFPNPPGTI